MRKDETPRTGGREMLRDTVRAMRILHEILPGFVWLTVVRAAINAIRPLLVLFFSARIIGELSGAQQVDTIIVYVALALGISFALSIVHAYVSKKLLIIDGTFHQRFYYYMSERYMHFDFEHVEKTDTNEQLADISAKVNGNSLGLPSFYWSFPSFVEHVIGLLVSGLLLIGMFSAAGTYVASFVTSPWATALLCVLIALMFLLTSALRRKEGRILEVIFSRNPKTNTAFQYYMRYMDVKYAAKDIRLYQQQSIFIKIMREWTKMDHWHEYFDFEGKLNGITRAANAVVGGVVYLLIGLRALYGMYGIGSVVQYVGAVTSLVGHVAAIITELGQVRNNHPHLTQFFAWLDKPDVKYEGTLSTEKRTDNAYEIAFHNVSFRYPGTDDYALRNLSISFTIGERLAVVGMNGSGKSTMIKLLCRLYDPTEGTITLNGIDIRKYDYGQYMDLFSVVFQDFQLFAFPVGQNVAASLDVEAERALRALGKTGFSQRLASMPQGLDTSLYKQYDKAGVDISGGEAQKIALARALYKDAPLIVLDEPTAALDPIAEYEVYTGINEIVDDKTAIFISHRLSSCRFCDNIAVFHEGALVQYGPHAQLLADAEGQYARLWYAQAQYYTDQEEKVLLEDG